MYVQYVISFDTDQAQINSVYRSKLFFLLFFLNNNFIKLFHLLSNYFILNCYSCGQNFKD